MITIFLKGHPSFAMASIRRVGSPGWEWHGRSGEDIGRPPPFCMTKGGWDAILFGWKALVLQHEATILYILWWYDGNSWANMIWYVLSLLSVYDEKKGAPTWRLFGKQKIATGLLAIFRGTPWRESKIGHVIAIGGFKKQFDIWRSNTIGISLVCHVWL